MRKQAVLITYLVIIGAASSFIYYWSNLPNKKIEKVLGNLKTEKEVIEVFGNPKTFYKGTENYYMEGYSFKKRKISNKALIYFPKNPTDVVADLILYVYIDDKGQVEGHFVGGS